MGEVVRESDKVEVPFESVAPDDDQRCIAWAREFFGKSEPFASTGAYINFLTQDETDRTEIEQYLNGGGRLFLTGLMRRIHRKTRVVNVSSAEALQALLATQ